MNLPLPLQPITEIDIVIILGWYIVFFVLANISSTIASAIYRSTQTVTMEKSPDFSMKKVVLAGPIEEMLFRGTAVAIATTMGWGLILPLFIANGIWAAFHQRRFGTFIFTFVLGLYLTRFWLEGFQGLWWIAVLIHSLHNFFIIAISEWVVEDHEIDPKKR